MTSRTSAISTTVGLATGATIYSGSAQISAIELIDDGASVAVVVVSVMIINARLLLYGGSIAPHWRGTGRVLTMPIPGDALRHVTRVSVSSARRRLAGLLIPADPARATPAGWLSVVAAESPREPNVQALGAE